MKPSVKKFRYVAALALFVATAALAGCRHDIGPFPGIGLILQNGNQVGFGTSQANPIPISPGRFQHVLLPAGFTFVDEAINTGTPGLSAQILAGNILNIAVASTATPGLRSFVVRVRTPSGEIVPVTVWVLVEPVGSNHGQGHGQGTGTS